MKLEVNISKKYFFILASILVLGFLAVGVSSYGGSNPSVMGHSGDEIEVTDAFCNKIMGHACGYDNEGGAGSATFDLVNGQHSGSQCVSAGGEVVSDGDGNDFCRFNSSSCFSGWFSYRSWTTTISTGADTQKWSCDVCSSGDEVICRTKHCEARASATGKHSWTDVSPEKSTFVFVNYLTGAPLVFYGVPVTSCCDRPLPYPLSAKVTQIGCY